MTRIRNKTTMPVKTHATRGTNGSPPKGPGPLHTVQKGESLRSIAQKKLGDGDRWPELAAANPQIKDPTKIYVGDQLRLPETSESRPFSAQQIDQRTDLSDEGHAANFASSSGPGTDGSLPSKGGVLHLLSASKGLAASDAKPGMGDLASTDDGLRAAALKSTQEAAAAGDRQALAKLASILADPRGASGLIDLDYDDRASLVAGAMKGLQGAKAYLGGPEYAALAKSLDSYDTRDAATSLLAPKVKAGDASALDAVRGQAAKGFEGREAANLLASAPDLGPKDYDLLAQAALDSVSDTPARTAIENAVDAGNPDAMSSLRAVLGKTGGGYVLRNQQSRASEILADHPGQITPADVDTLRGLATTGDDHRARAASFEALAAAASRTPPVPGAAQAFAAVMKDVPPIETTPNTAYLGDELSPLRDVEQQYAAQAFEAARGDPQAQAALAPYALTRARDEKTALAAIKTLEPAAIKGDSTALAALARASGRSTVFSSSKAQQAAVTTLEKAAAGGQAAKVVDALQAELKRTGHSDRGRAYEALGAASRHLPADGSRQQSVRETLRQGVANDSGRAGFGHDSAAAGMAAAGNLSDADIKSLTDHLDEDAGRTLAGAANSMSPEQRDQLRATLRDKLTTGHSRRGALVAMAGMADHLGLDDVKMLKREARTINGDPMARTALAGVLDGQADTAIKDQAARALIDASEGYSAAPLDTKSLQSLVDHAAASKDANLKQAVLDKLPTSPVDSKQLKRVAQTYGQMVRDKIKNAPDGSNWRQLGKLLSAREMADAPQFATHIDRAKVDQKINELSNGPLKSDLASVRRQAIRRATPAGTGPKQEEYIKSDGFQQRLALLPESRQSSLIQNEMAKLEGVAPERVRETADYLAGRAIQGKALASFQRLEGEGTAQEDALGSAITSVTGATRTSGGVTKKIIAVLNKLDPNTRAERVATQLLHGLEEAQVAARRLGDVQDVGRAQRAIDLIKNLDSRGKLSTVLSGAALLGVIAKGVPQDGHEWALSSSAVLNAAGNASDIGKLFRVSNAGKLGGALKAMDWLGPAGDLVGAGADAYGAWKDFEQGDQVGGWSKTVGAASGVTGAVAGVAILAGASGPAAPAVLLGATVVGLGSWAVDSIWGKSDEQSFLENLGVWQE